MAWLARWANSFNATVLRKNACAMIADLVKIEANPMTSLFHISRSVLARRVLVALLEAMFVLIAGASAWHPLHEWLHPDAGHEDHECAVTLFHSGNVEVHAAVLQSLGPPVEAVCGEAALPIETTDFPLRRSGVLEHAPPVCEVVGAHN
jgi:hypothetical protein